MTPNNPQKKGCWFYGCLSLAVIVIVGSIGGYFLVRYAVNSAKEAVTNYTDTKPAEITYAETSKAEVEALQQRVAEFHQSLEKQDQSRELILTADDINALIANDPSFKDLKGKLYVMIEGSEIKGRVSFPLDDIGPFKLKGRYLNGVATFKVALTNDNLFVTLTDVQVKGKPLPSAFLTQLKDTNLAKDVANDPKNAKSIRRFESIQVKDGKVILRNKAKP